jgi:hypothetical protein
MPDEIQIIPSRPQIAIRLLYTLIYVAIFEVVKAIIVLITVFEFFFLLLTLRHNEATRTFGNQVATYGYRVMRYLTLNENQRPFPYAEFPTAVEPPDEGVKFE